MAYDIPTDIPTLFTAGDTLKFTKELADYLPADGWTLTYSLVKSSAQIQFSASDNGDGTHLVNVATTTTDDWTAGDYRWQATGLTACRCACPKLCSTNSASGKLSLAVKTSKSRRIPAVAC